MRTLLALALALVASPASAYQLLSATDPGTNDWLEIRVTETPLEAVDWDVVSAFGSGLRAEMMRTYATDGTATVWLHKTLSRLQMSVTLRGAYMPEEYRPQVTGARWSADGWSGSMPFNFTTMRNADHVSMHIDWSRGGSDEPTRIWRYWRIEGGGTGYWQYVGGTLVPEPAALALLLPMLGMLRRRMRSNRSAMTAP